MKQRECIPNSESALDKCVSRFKREIIDRFFPDEGHGSAVEYVLVELLNNAFEHGNKRDARKAIIVEWEVREGNLTLSVEDEGNGFIPRIPKEPPPMKEPRGRGLWSIKADVHSLAFNKKGNKVTVTIIKEHHV